MNDSPSTKHHVAQPSAETPGAEDESPEEATRSTGKSAARAPRAPRTARPATKKAAAKRSHKT